MNKLKSIVGVAVKNGFDLKHFFGTNFKIITWVDIHDDFGNNYIRIKYTLEFHYDYLYKDFSVSDLLFNHEFMRALCPAPEWNTVDHTYYMERVVMLPTDQERIDYVYDLIKGDI